MPSVPATVSKRLSATVPRYQKNLQFLRDRDVNEADTVVIVADMLSEVFGYDKYTEITREYAIKGTYCDIAIKRDGANVDVLVEVKAIGLELKDIHLRQVINYASQSGITWAVLTNGIHWQVHRVSVDGTVNHEKFLEFNFLELSGRKKEDQQALFTLCKRALDKDYITEVYEYKQSVNRYAIGAILQTGEASALVRRILRKIKPGLKVTSEEIGILIESEVLRREVTQSEEAKSMLRRVKRALSIKRKAR